MTTLLFANSLLLAAAARPTGPLPDVIVTHLTASSDALQVHLQNQGAGAATRAIVLKVSRQGKPGGITFKVAAPRKPFDVNSSPSIPLRRLGLKPDWTSQIFQVDLDPSGQERNSNKTYYQQIDRYDGKVSIQKPPFQNSHPGLPDLVITRVYYDRPHYIKVAYSNVGKGASGGDFLIAIRSGEQTFDGNYYYRFPVPKPGQTLETGGFTLGLIGLKPGMVAPVTVTIDPEKRVRESNAQNNRWRGQVDLR